MKDKFICLDCAENLGAEFKPEARAAQAYIGRCDSCGNVKLVASSCNWNFPTLR